MKNSEAQKSTIVEFETRHEQWLKSLKKPNRSTGPVVIKMTAYVAGKTATALSERELEVLQLISYGKSTREIANKLCLSIHTINNHRKNMLCRSRCGNFAELVQVAIKEGLLP